ncbi:MAG TPA: MMPL family transporter [Thermomicrobiales bacterium]|jgi:RND superfamily putative drug exporter|nr:MMPL family transporter [Thermomicrobiales bacterium]
MFLRWGMFVAAHRRAVLILSLASLILSLLLIAFVPLQAQENELVSRDAESIEVAMTLASRFGLGDSAIIFLVDADASVLQPETQRRIITALTPLADEDGVLGVASAATTGSADFISLDGQSTYVVALIDQTGFRRSAEIVETIQQAGESQGLTINATGASVINDDVTERVESGLIRAEIISIPLTTIFLILIFGGVIAAGLPLATGAVAIIATIGVTFGISGFTDQSLFSLNLITMLGLGLGVDYSLFMVSRFREELTRRSVDDAVAVTVGTVGKAVFFSAITVMFGLSATFFFPIPTVAQMGQAGILVVGLALVYGLTFLPALLAILGPRVNRLPVRRRSAVPRRDSGFWHGLAELVMRRPVAFLIPIMILLLALSIPILHLNLTPGNVNIMGPDAPSRIVADRLDTEFPANRGNAIPIVATAADGDALSADSVAALRDLAGRIEQLEGVSEVESLVSGPLAEQNGFDWTGWTGDRETLTDPVLSTLPATVNQEIALLQVSQSRDEIGAERLVQQIRGLDVPGLSLQVGGDAAIVVDLREGIIDALPAALLFVFAGSYLILLLSFGSLLLPLKAIFMTLLSITSSLGIVIVVFQDGLFADLLRFTADGQLVATTPILMFCVLYGLSMDYEVLLLARVQEEYLRTGDNRQSVAAGIESTGAIITGAAAIMIAVFGGFVAAEVTVIKSLGFGLAVAVFIDATIVRSLLVPSTMRLLGEWNWWAPAPIRRAIDRLGFGHHDLPLPPSPTPAPAD